MLRDAAAALLVHQGLVGAARLQVAETDEAHVAGLGLILGKGGGAGAHHGHGAQTPAISGAERPPLRPADYRLERRRAEGPTARRRWLTRTQGSEGIANSGLIARGGTPASREA